MTKRGLIGVGRLFATNCGSRLLFATGFSIHVRGVGCCDFRLNELAKGYAEPMVAGRPPLPYSGIGKNIVDWGFQAVPDMVIQDSFSPLKEILFIDSKEKTEERRKTGEFFIA